MSAADENAVEAVVLCVMFVAFVAGACVALWLLTRSHTHPIISWEVTDGDLPMAKGKWRVNTAKGTVEYLGKALHPHAAGRTQEGYRRGTERVASAVDPEPPAAPVTDDRS